MADEKYAKLLRKAESLLSPNQVLTINKQLLQQWDQADQADQAKTKVGCLKA